MLMRNRTARMLPWPPAHVFPQDAVIAAGKSRKTTGGIAQDDLRRAENLAGSQMEGEKVGVDSHLHRVCFLWSCWADAVKFPL